MGAPRRHGIALLLIILATSTHQAAAVERAPAPCVLDVLVLEKSARQLSLKLRDTCQADKARVKATLANALSTAAQAAAPPPVLRLFMGRLVEHPWLSLSLARAALASPEWDRLAGKPRHRALNPYVGALLRLSGALDDLVPGMTLQSVAVEKVLVQPAAKVNGLSTTAKDRAQVPYDGQLWLTYTAAPPSAVGPAPVIIPPARLEE